MQFVVDWSRSHSQLISIAMTAPVARTPGSEVALIPAYVDVIMRKEIWARTIISNTLASAHYAVSNSNPNIQK